MPNLSRNPSGTLSLVAPSQRLRKTEATERTSGLSPADTRRSKPRIYASADARLLLAREKKRDINTDTVCNRFLDCRHAVTCAGILMNRFGRFPFPSRNFAVATDFLVLQDAERDAHTSSGRCKRWKIFESHRRPTVGDVLSSPAIAVSWDESGGALLY